MKSNTTSYSTATFTRPKKKTWDAPTTTPTNADNIDSGPQSDDYLDSEPIDQCDTGTGVSLPDSNNSLSYGKFLGYH